MKYLLIFLIFCLSLIIILLLKTKENYDNNLIYNFGSSIVDAVGKCKNTKYYYLEQHNENKSKGKYLKIFFDLENNAQTGNTNQITNENNLIIEHVDSDNINDIIEYKNNNKVNCIIRTPNTGKIFHNDKEINVKDNNIDNTILVENLGISGNVNLIEKNKGSRIICIRMYDIEENEYLVYNYTSDRLIKEKKETYDNFSLKHLYKIIKNSDETFSISPLLRPMSYISSNNDTSVLSTILDDYTKFKIRCLDLSPENKLNGEIKFYFKNDRGKSVEYTMQLKDDGFLYITNYSGVKRFKLLSKDNLSFEFIKNTLYLRSNSIDILVIKINPNEDLSESNSINQLYPLDINIPTQPTLPPEKVDDEPEVTESVVKKCYFTPRGTKEINCFEKCINGSEWNNCSTDECLLKCAQCIDKTKCKWLNDDILLSKDQCSHKPYGLDLEDCKTQCLALGDNCSKEKCSYMCDNCNNTVLCKWKKNRHPNMITKNKPSSPVIEAISKNNSVDIVWKRPVENNSQISKYIVMAYEKDNKELGTRMEISSNPSCIECIHTIEDLKNNIDYVINVMAVNSIGMSPASNTVRVKPLNTNPSSKGSNNMKKSMVKNISSNDDLVNDLINNIAIGDNSNNNKLLNDVSSLRNEQDIISNLKNSSEEYEWMKNLNNIFFEIDINKDN